MTKPTAAGWLIIVTVAVLAVLLIARLPDGDAPINHDYGDYVSEETQMPSPSLPLSTGTVIQTSEPEVEPFYDGHSEPLSPTEADEIAEALFNTGYFRRDVPLDWLYQDYLRTACQIYSVPFELMLGLIDVESNFYENAVSSANCFGLYQLHPAYYDPDMTIEEQTNAAVELLATYYDKYGNWASALCAYNAGRDTGARTYANAVMAAARDWGWKP